MAIEFTKEGSALDAQLRREQAKAVFDLLPWYRQQGKGKDDDD